MLNRRLLILSCSQRKRPDIGLLPALERYNGPAFQVLRKFLRECSLKVRDVDVYILSAEFGLIPADQPIPNYDRRMTARRARELLPQVLAKLGYILQSKHYEELFISAGKDYLTALTGYEQLVPIDLEMILSKETQGHKLTKLRDWLHGDRLPVPLRSHRTITRSDRACTAESR